MYADKYPTILSRQMEAIVYLFVTLRHYSHYSLFAIRDYSLFAIRDYSLFAIRVFQTPSSVNSKTLANVEKEFLFLQ